MGNIGNKSIYIKTTDELEQELRELSEQIETGRQRFDEVRRMLKDRHEVGDEQPPLEVTTAESRRRAADALERNLILKITAMEQEQAKLVVESEMSRIRQVEAENRLALVVKWTVPLVESGPSHLRPVLARDEAVALIRAAAREAPASEAPSGVELPDWEPQLWMVDVVMSASLVRAKATSVGEVIQLLSRYRAASSSSSGVHTADQSIGEFVVPGWVIDAIIEAGR